MREIIKTLVYSMPFLGNYYKLRTCNYAGFSFCGYFRFIFFTKNKAFFWPKTATTLIVNPQNMKIGKNSSIGNHGCYIQGNGYLFIGNYVRVAPNVGILSGNHDVYNQKKQIKKTTVIGDFSWIGMNSVVLPGVKLGERTIVAAGSVVTKSFPDGFCIIGGNPARLIKVLDKEKFVPHTNKYEFYGYIPADNFEKFKAKYLK